MKKEVASLIETFNREHGSKECRYWLFGMGAVVTEGEINAIWAKKIRQECLCPDDSGSCDACAEYYGGGFENA